MAQSLSQRADLARNQLFERYDVLNALWLEAETELSKLHIPHDIQIEYASWGEYDEYHNCLGMQKLKGKWRICHGTCFDGNGREVDDWMPITECSALVRTLAASHILALREAIVARSEKFVLLVDKAIASLRNDLAKIEGARIVDALTERTNPNGKAK